MTADFLVLVRRRPLRAASRRGLGAAARLAIFGLALAANHLSAAELGAATEPASASVVPAAESTDKVDFEMQILPVFKRNCLACHSETDPEADLVLETPAAILKGSEDGPVVVPHKSLESALVKSAARESKPFMPPKNNKVGAEALTPDEVAMLRKWIDQGATGIVRARARPIQWQPLPAGLHPILATTVTRDGQFAACSRANQIFVYHLPTGRLAARLTDPGNGDASNGSGYRGAAERDFVQSLAFSPDGLVLASGGYRSVKLWQREPNLPAFPLGGGPVSAIATSPDGRWIATAGSDFVIRLWDAAGGKAGAEMSGHTGLVAALRFSPDGTKLASGSVDKSIRIWSVADGKPVGLADAGNEVAALAWVLDGKQLATAGGDALIRLWRLPSDADGVLTKSAEIPGHADAVTCLAAFPSGGKQLLSGSRDGAVCQWTLEPPKLVRQSSHGAAVTAVAVAPNSKVFASAGGSTAKLWNAENGQPLGELKGDHRARARLAQTAQTIAFEKSETTHWAAALEAATKTQIAKADAVKKATEAAAAAEKTVSDKKEALEKAADDKAKAAGDEAVSKAVTAKAGADGALRAAKAASADAERAVAEAKTGSEEARAASERADEDGRKADKAMSESEKPIQTIAFSPDNLCVATGGDDQTIRTWSAETGAGFDTYPGQVGAVREVAYTADGRLVSSAAELGAVVWHTAPAWSLARTIGSGEEKSPLANRVLALDFSPDGQLLATGGGVPSRSGEVEVWRVADGSLALEIPHPHSDTVFGVAFSPDGKLLATCGADKFVKVFETSGGKLVKSLSGHTHYVLAVGWKADGRMLASSGADKVVKLWSFPAGEQIKTIEGFNKEVTSVRYLGIGAEVLAAAADPKLRLLKEDGGTAREFSAGKGFVFSTASTSDGRLVLAGGQDSILRIWEAASGKTLFELGLPMVEEVERGSHPSAPK